MTKVKERRQFWRIHFQAIAQLKMGAASWRCLLKDISLKGALLELPEPIAIAAGSECQLTLELGSGTKIVMRVNVMDAHGTTVRVRCDSIDLDSVTHLRRLVELNAGDQHAFERDLSALFHRPHAER